MQGTVLLLKVIGFWSFNLSIKENYKLFFSASIAKGSISALRIQRHDFFAVIIKFGCHSNFYRAHNVEQTLNMLVSIIILTAD